MHRVMLLNSKGGCGKTTIATNLAGCYAHNGLSTVLIDHDGQGSSTRWLQARSQHATPIHGIEAYQEKAAVTKSFMMRLPEGTERVVIDTPANVKGQQLAELVSRTDSIVVPVLSSQIDIDAVSKFMIELRKLPRVRGGEVRVAVVANRAREKTVMFLDLERFLLRSEFAFVARLRDSQHYMQAAETGLGIHELRGTRVRTDIEQWAPLISWVEEGAEETPFTMATAQSTQPAAPADPVSTDWRQHAFSFSQKNMK
jgi:chromosome partitioning protein